MDSLNDDRSSRADDVLARCISVVRAEDDVEGPSPEVHRRVLVALSRPAPEPRHPVNFFQRTFHMIRVHKWAATLTLGAGGMIAWALLVLLNPWSPVSYGAVAEQIKAAQTIQYRITAVVNGAEVPGGASAVFMKEPGHVRIESSAGVMISDASAGKVLTLTPKTRSAQLVTMQSAAATAPGGHRFDSIEGFKRLAEANGKPTADRTIGGVNAKGFDLQLGSQHAVMWVDPKSHLPLRIESSATAAGQQVDLVLTDFVFDRPLDDALFSLTPPKGFTLSSSTVNLPAEGNACETVAAVLRAYAARAEGRFPKSLSDWGDFAVVMSKGSKNGELDADARQAMTNLGALTPLTFGDARGTDYDYTPGNAKLGDAGKIVFWSRDKETHAYRAVFGDLSIRNVSQAELTGR